MVLHIPCNIYERHTSKLRGSYFIPFFHFQTFLNQKYGRLVAPCRILASAFDRLLKKVGDMKDKDLLMRCYKLDQNAVPAVYVLQGSSTPDTEKEKICQILRSSWSKEEKELYLASGKVLFNWCS